MNKVILSGRIGTDINRFGNDNSGGASFKLVTSKPKFADGEVVRDPQTGYPETYDQWHFIKAFNGLGRSVANHKRKGEQLIVMGEIRYEKTEKDGTTYHNTIIVAEEIQFV